MSEPIDSQLNLDAESESLRRTLDHLRQEAEAEIKRLSTLLSQHDYSPSNQVASATERLALQQEMVVMQQALEAKEQALDHITAECRRLEDALEDQQLALEGRSKDIERKEQALLEAQVEIDRLRQELLDASRQTAAPPPTTPQPVPNARRSIAPPWLLASTGLLGVLLIASVFINVQLLGRQPAAPEALTERTPVASAPKPPPTTTPDAGNRPASTTPKPPPPERGPTTTTAAPRIHQDRLRDGTPGPAMVVLTGGSFRMGHNSLGGEDYSPARSVQIKPFMLAAHEVTFLEYDRFARATGRELPNDQGWGRGTRPVIGISWKQARDYTLWLAQETAQGYRLPSEAEWEFAARAGTTTPFWWGQEIGSKHAVCADCGSEWDNRSTAPVMSLDANPFGLYDMTGNALEWVADCYRARYDGAPDDGRALLTGDCATRVARGGAFNQPADALRSFVRARFAVDTQLTTLGFRVARDL